MTNLSRRSVLAGALGFAAFALAKDTVSAADDLPKFVMFHARG